MMIVGIAGHAGSGKDTVARVFIDNYGFRQIALADPLKQFCRSVFDWSHDQLWGPSQYRNDVDGRYHSFRTEVGADGSPHVRYDAAWGAARHHLEQFGRSWVHRILSGGTSYPAEVATPEAQQAFEEGAYAALVEWFHQLGNQHPSDLSPRIALQTLGTEWGRQSVTQDIWIKYAIHRAMGEILKGDVNGVVISDVRFLNELEAILNVGGKLLHIERPVAKEKSLAVGVTAHASETEQSGFDLQRFNFLFQNDGTVSELLSDVHVCASCLGLTRV